MYFIFCISPNVVEGLPPALRAPSPSYEKAILRLLAMLSITVNVFVCVLVSRQVSPVFCNPLILHLLVEITGHVRTKHVTTRAYIASHNMYDVITD